jgi:hypothetical protein
MEVLAERLRSMLLQKQELFPKESVRNVGPCQMRFDRAIKLSVERKSVKSYNLPANAAAEPGAGNGVTCYY